MPHIILKLQSGRTDTQKKAIAEELTRALVASAKCTEDAVSVSIEDVEAQDWVETVYKPDIMGRAGTLYKKPGYDPL
jgi:4-oxalocrotonate tautomerase